MYLPVDKHVDTRLIVYINVHWARESMASRLHPDGHGVSGPLLEIQADKLLVISHRRRGMPFHHKPNECVSLL